MSGRRTGRAAAIAGLLAAGALFTAGSGPTAAAPSPPPRHPAAVAAEEAFFAAFNGGGRRDAPLRPLIQAWAADAADPRTNLLLGLNHLWVAAEGDRTDARIIEHLVLAETFLARAQELAPEDERIPSWLVPTRLALAEIEGDEAATAAIEEELLTAYRRDPAFHGFSVALLGFGEPPGSPEFTRGLAALDEVDAMGCLPEDPTCENHPRWPHNIEGYLTFQADYLLKAGKVERAAETLASVRAQPTYAAWPFRAEVEDRVEHLALYAELYANDDRGDDPPSIVASHGCRSCHQGGAG